MICLFKDQEVRVSKSTFERVGSSDAANASTDYDDCVDWHCAVVNHALVRMRNTYKSSPMFLSLHHRYGSCGLHRSATPANVGRGYADVCDSQIFRAWKLGDCGAVSPGSECREDLGQQHPSSFPNAWCRTRRSKRVMAALLKDKVVIVTGASHGIGAECAMRKLVLQLPSVLILVRSRCRPTWRSHCVASSRTLHGTGGCSHSESDSKVESEVCSSGRRYHRPSDIRKCKWHCTYPGCFLADSISDFKSRRRHLWPGRLTHLKCRRICRRAISHAISGVMEQGIGCQPQRMLSRRSGGREANDDSGSASSNRSERQHNMYIEYQRYKRRRRPKSLQCFKSWDQELDGKLCCCFGNGGIRCNSLLPGEKIPT